MCHCLGPLSPARNPECGWCCECGFASVLVAFLCWLGVAGGPRGAAVSSCRCWSWAFSRSFQQQEPPGFTLHCSPAPSQLSAGWRCAGGSPRGSGWDGGAPLSLSQKIHVPPPQELPPGSVWTALHPAAPRHSPAQPAGKWKRGHSHPKMVQILQKLQPVAADPGVQHRSSPCPAPSTLPRPVFGCCGAEPRQDPPLPSAPVGVTKAGLGPWAGSRGKGGVGRGLRARLVPTPFHHTMLLQAQHSSRFLIPRWFPHAVSFWC